MINVDANDKWKIVTLLRKILTLKKKKIVVPLGLRRNPLKFSRKDGRRIFKLPYTVGLIISQDSLKSINKLFNHEVWRTHVQDS